MENIYLQKVEFTANNNCNIVYEKKWKLKNPKKQKK